jgi:hypothetical protein
VLLLGFALYGSFQVYGLSIKVQATTQLRDRVVQGKSNEFDRLIELAMDLSDSSVLEGGYQDYLADAYSLSFERNPESEIQLNTLVQEYRTAVYYKPYNGALWSRYAMYLSHYEGVSEQMLVAIDRALEFGRNDYVTLKNLVYIAIRSWPKFNCQYKELMLGIIRAGLTKNDHILSRWNTVNNHMVIGKYVTTLVRFYGFDEEWADIQVRVCLQN